MRLAIVLIWLLLLSSCKVVQDVGYARWQANNSLEVQAEASLQELSNDGYVEARLALADLYSRSDELEKLLLAGDYYKEMRDVSEKADYKYVRWLGRMSYRESSYREGAYRELWKRQESKNDVLYLLAQFYSHHGEIYPPEELESIFPELLVDIDANKESLVKVINTMNHPERFSEYISQLCGVDPEPALRSDCYQLAFKLAKMTNDEVIIDGLVQQFEKRIVESIEENNTTLDPVEEETLYRCASILLNDENGPRHIIAGLKVASLGYDLSPRLFLLGAKVEYKRKILMPNNILLSGLQKLANENNPDATLILGRMFAEGYRVVDDPLKGEYLLRKLIDNPRAELYLGRLYLSGKLGVEKLQDGVDTLLSAGRNGSHKAYYHLAKAFNGYPGIKRNSTFSWVFANMAKTSLDMSQESDELDMLIQILDAEIIEETVAMRLLQTEQVYLGMPYLVPYSPTPVINNKKLRNVF